MSTIGLYSRKDLCPLSSMQEFICVGALSLMIMALILLPRQCVECTSVVTTVCGIAVVAVAMVIGLPYSGYY